MVSGPAGSTVPTNQIAEMRHVHDQVDPHLDATAASETV